MSSPYDLAAFYREGGDPTGPRRTIEVYADLWDIREDLEREVRTLLERRWFRRHFVMYERLSALVREFDRLAQLPARPE